jgi:hypothetical protein
VHAHLYTFEAKAHLNDRPTQKEVLKRTNPRTFRIGLLFKNVVINLNHLVLRLLSGKVTQTDGQTES